MSFHIKIGNYRFSKNLGKGSFGKVKCNLPLQITYYSGIQWDYSIKGGNQNHEQEINKVVRSVGES